MLSDEEKKAIKEVKHFKELTRYWQEEEYEEKEIAGYIAVILNLIEKQSKEIEEYKKQLDLDYVENNYTPNYKIENLIAQIESAIDFMKTNKSKIKVNINEQREEDLRLEIVHLKRLLEKSLLEKE